MIEIKECELETMRILVLTQVVVYPADAGPKVKTLQVLRYLAAQHEVIYCTFVRSEQEARVGSENARIAAENRTDTDRPAARARYASHTARDRYSCTDAAKRRTSAFSTTPMRRDGRANVALLRAARRSCLQQFAV